jgi:1-acyl-sn-glycerol-3-phosphate acyltransferase
MKSILDRVLNLVLPWRWWFAYRRYVIKITTSGYIPPDPPMWMRRLARVLVRIWQWIQVGKVTVVDGHYFDTPGRVIFCGNHGSLLDVMVVYPALRRPLRAMGAYEVMRRLGGLAGIAMTKMGVFPVDRSHGRTVIGPAIDLLVAGHALGLMPEGKINPTGELLPFKLGAAWIASGAYERLGGTEPVGIVPFHICYHKRHVPSALNFLKMGLRWRGGATLTALPPIWLNELDNRDPQHIMCLVRNAIASVDCATTSGSRCNN